MSYVKRNEWESIDSLLARFNRQFQASGILKDLKRHEFYEKPCIRKRRKQREAMLKKLQRERKGSERAIHKAGNKRQGRQRNKQSNSSNE